VAGMTAEDAEEYTQALGLVMAGGWRQIALGRRMGVPDALGLTVQQWVDDRLGGYVRLSLKERPYEMKEAVKELTKPVEAGGEGLSTRQAAEVLGVSHTTVRRAAVTNVPPETQAPEGAITEPVTNIPTALERNEPKSHAVAHEERKEASRQQSEARLTLPDLADLGLDRIEYGTSALAYLKGCEAKRAQVCITSPPYWKKRTYIPGEPLELGQEPAPELYVDALCEIINEAGRVLKDDGCVFLNLGDTLASQPGQYRGDPARRRGISDQAVRANGTAGAARELDVADKSYVLIPERIVLSLVLEHRWRLAGKIVWHKVGHGPENVYDRLTQAWEPIYVLTRAEHAFFERQPGRDDVWPIPVGRQGGAGGHLAPFPEALVERAIKQASEPGDIVLDPFAGSGTVLEVARRMGRRFLGCDLAVGSAA
jgi:site-specific DNA-methyltransferase (cytosine-N4-specific)